MKKGVLLILVILFLSGCVKTERNPLDSFLGTVIRDTADGFTGFLPGTDPGTTGGPVLDHYSLQVANNSVYMLAKDYSTQNRLYLAIFNGLGFDLVALPELVQPANVSDFYELIAVAFNDSTFTYSFYVAKYINGIIDIIYVFSSTNPSVSLGTASVVAMPAGEKYSTGIRYLNGTGVPYYYFTTDNIAVPGTYKTFYSTSPDLSGAVQMGGSGLCWKMEVYGMYAICGIYNYIDFATPTVISNIAPTGIPSAVNYIHLDFFINGTSIYSIENDPIIDTGLQLQSAPMATFPGSLTFGAPLFTGLSIPIGADNASVKDVGDGISSTRAMFYQYFDVANSVHYPYLYITTDNYATSLTPGVIPFDHGGGRVEVFYHVNQFYMIGQDVLNNNATVLYSSSDGINWSQVNYTLNIIVP